jgi:hypothetical protein
MALRYTVDAVLRARDDIAIGDVHKDFKLVQGGTTSPERVRDDPNISLYALSRDGMSVTFVETPPGLDQYAASFSYQAQRNHAVAVHELSLEEFGHIASDIRFAATDVLLIFSVGRCGSTLLHHILNRSTGIRSLSEPGFFSNVQQLGTDVSGQAKIGLLRDATRIMFLKSQVRDRLFALKLRSENCGLWLLLDHALDQPRSLFLYRNAVDTVKSYDRLFSAPFRQPHAGLLRLSARSSLVRFLYGGIRTIGNRSSARLRTIGRSEYSPEDVLLTVGPEGHWVLIWLAKVAAYMRALERSGDAVFALRFEDLVGKSQATIEKLFAVLGLPADQAQSCCDALRRDAHEGTFLSRPSVPPVFDVRTARAIEDVLRPIDCIGGYPTLLPNTIRP